MAGSEQQQASAEYQNETPEEQKAKVARMQFVARIVAIWSVIRFELPFCSLVHDRFGGQSASEDHRNCMVGRAIEN
jgi:hypothetical protein